MGKWWLKASGLSFWWAKIFSVLTLPTDNCQKSFHSSERSFTMLLVVLLINIRLSNASSCNWSYCWNAQDYFTGTNWLSQWLPSFWKKQAVWTYWLQGTSALAFHSMTSLQSTSPRLIWVLTKCHQFANLLRRLLPWFPQLSTNIKCILYT